MAKYNFKEAPVKTQVGPKMKFTNQLESIFEQLADVDDDIAFELLYLLEDSTKYFNGLNIIEVDVSNVKSFFAVDIKGKQTITDMPIDNFIKYFFKNKFKDSEIKSFVRKYNLVSTGQSAQGEPIIISQFAFNPKDVKSTFLSLVSKTYPHGSEGDVLKFLPRQLKKDIIGNYYMIIGDEPETMFASHLDTADRASTFTKLFLSKDDGDEIITTDGRTILGADDKAGVTVMMYMIENRVPGLYLFFIGEEVGCVGSSGLAKSFNKVDYLKKIKRCISFDRKNYHSVITKQLGEECCSDDFGLALCSEFNKNGMTMEKDPTGVYTDSASFVDYIPECTNISVGYFSEHTRGEHQNISFLDRLAKSCVKVNWSSLPTVRKAGLDEETLKKYADFIEDVRNINYGVELKFMTGRRGAYLQINLEYCEIDDIYSTMVELSAICYKHKIPQLTTFDRYMLRIDFKEDDSVYTHFGKYGNLWSD